MLDQEQKYVLLFSAIKVREVKPSFRMISNLRAYDFNNILIWQKNFVVNEKNWMPRSDLFL
jgi:hypothetical protein